MLIYVNKMACLILRRHQRARTMQYIRYPIVRTCTYEVTRGETALLDVCQWDDARDEE